MPKKMDNKKNLLEEKVISIGRVTKVTKLELVQEKLMKYLRLLKKHYKQLIKMSLRYL